MTSIESPWLTAAESAQYSRRSVSTINNALRDGSLRGYQPKKNGTWRIHRDDLDAWMRGERADATPARIARRTA